jgi:fermentation-respiration switch protein FrsA (DUF1100 family)
MTAIVKYALLTLLFYTAYCCLLFFLQRRILFPRSLIPSPPSSEDTISGMEIIWLDTAYGKVEAWFLPASVRISRPSPAVIFGHGNGELIDFWPAEFKRFAHLGIGVLLVEYPGYGRSAGNPSQQSITAAFVSAYDVLTSRKDVDPSRIVFFGRSLGGGAVCALAGRRVPKALVLMSTFTSVHSFTSRYLLPPFLVRDPFDNLAVVKAFRGPILILHGKHDEIIPFSHGVSLDRAAQNSKMIAYDAGHNDCPPDWSVFWKDIEAFLKDAGII